MVAGMRIVAGKTVPRGKGRVDVLFDHQIVVAILTEITVLLQQAEGMLCFVKRSVTELAYPAGYRFMLVRLGRVFSMTFSVGAGASQGVGSFRRLHMKWIFFLCLTG